MTKCGPVTEVIRFAQQENESARLRALKIGSSYTQSLLKKTIRKIPAETKFLEGLLSTLVLSQKSKIVIGSIEEKTLKLETISQAHQPIQSY